MRQSTAVFDHTLLELDAATFKRSFNRRAFKLQHHLSRHPLLELPRLLELARALPEKLVEYRDGNGAARVAAYTQGAAGESPDSTPRAALSAGETLRRLEEECFSLVLKNVERDPQYKALLNACLDQIQSFSEAFAPGMCGREATILIASPCSTMPFHIEPRYGFHLQITGTPLMTVFDCSVLPVETLENYFSGAPRSLEFKPEYQSKSQTFELSPGTGLHLPVTAPHLMRNGDEISISLLISFQTPENERRRTIYRANAELRKRGLKPAMIGNSRLRDGVKVNAYHALRRARIAGRATLGPHKQRHF